MAVLEGGYDVQALEVSSEAVVRTLLLPPDDKDGFAKLLQELSGRPEQSLTQMETEALINPREAFKQTASNLAKLLKG